MHDIVRDYVINQHSKEELRALQRVVVDTVLAARPEPNGFITSEYTLRGTFDDYCARHLFWHLRGAVGEGEEPPKAWLRHSDDGIRASVAFAVGFTRLSTLSEAREAAGDLVTAAHISWAAMNIDSDRLYK